MSHLVFLLWNPELYPPQEPPYERYPSSVTWLLSRPVSFCSLLPLPLRLYGLPTGQAINTMSLPTSTSAVTSPLGSTTRPPDTRSLRPGAARPSPITTVADTMSDLPPPVDGKTFLWVASRLYRAGWFKTNYIWIFVFVYTAPRKINKKKAPVLCAIPISKYIEVQCQDTLALFLALLHFRFSRALLRILTIFSLGIYYFFLLFLLFDCNFTSLIYYFMYSHFHLTPPFFLLHKSGHIRCRQCSRCIDHADLEWHHQEWGPWTCTIRTTWYGNI